MTRRLLRVTVAAAALATSASAAVGVASAAAAPAQKTITGLHDDRYCEILEVKGLPPTAKVTVWNTIGLNACPPSLWKFDAPALAKELGDTAVVLNGPRHWLMDAVKGRVGRTVKSFHGLKMRQAATIAIKTPAELVQSTYTDRTVIRDNTWSWNKGRRVFELVAPGGDVYVMQSYSQIKNPSLTLAQLKTLGGRLKLPQGWRYRSRVLKARLALKANGGATITQDDLSNTYQLERTTRPKGPRTKHAVSISGRSATVPTGVPGLFEDHGTVMSTPFGTGALALVGTLANGKLTGTLRLLFAKGSVVATFDMPFTLDPDGRHIHFRGTSRITGGTGAYRGITSGDLATLDDNTLDGQNGIVSATGSATF